MTYPSPQRALKAPQTIFIRANFRALELALLYSIRLHGSHWGNVSWFAWQIRARIHLILFQIFPTGYLFTSQVVSAQLLKHSSALSISINPVDPLNQRLQIFFDKLKTYSLFSKIIVTAFARIHTHPFYQVVFTLRNMQFISLFPSQPHFSILRRRVPLRSSASQMPADSWPILFSFGGRFQVVAFYVIFVMNKFCSFGKSDRLLDKQDNMLLIPEISIPQVKEMCYGLR